MLAFLTGGVVRRSNFGAAQTSRMTAAPSAGDSTRKPIREYGDLKAILTTPQQAAVEAKFQF
jgi:hypothetical protein